MTRAIGPVGVRRRLAAAMGAALLVGAAAHPQEPAPTPTPETFGFGAWLVGCVNSGLETVRCEMNQRVVDETGSQQILLAAIAASHDAPPAELVFLTPLGIWLEPGAFFVIPSSNTTRTLVFERCAPNGCVVRLPLDAELRALLEASDLAQLSFADRLRQPLSTPIALDGFAEALARVEMETQLLEPTGRGVWGWLRRWGG